MLEIFATGSTDLESTINSLSINTVLVASLLLVVLLGISSQIVKNKKYKLFKAPLFIAIAATIVLPSLLLMGSTVYVNTVSESKGPVHWHTDIEFWVCGQEIELRNPTGILSNKNGTSTYHEHDDKRMHLEGVVVEKDIDASLKKFMDVTGGKISSEKLVIPTESSVFENDIDGDKPRDSQQLVKNYLEQDASGLATISVTNGQVCEYDQAAEIQAFLYRYNKDDNTYTQTKLNNPGAYVMRDESIVPPADCLVVEFDTPKTKTNRLCQQYGVRDSLRCTEFGVSEFNPDLCNAEQITSTEGTQ